MEGHARAAQLMRAALQGFMSSALKQRLNGWLHVVSERHRAMAQMHAALMSFCHRGMRAGLNTLIVRRQERLIALERLRRAAHALVHRTQLRCLRKLAVGGRLFAIARGAARSFLHRSLRQGLNCWMSTIEDRVLALVQIRAATAAFRQRSALFDAAFYHAQVSGAARACDLCSTKSVATAAIPQAAWH